MFNCLEECNTLHCDSYCTAMLASRFSLASDVRDVSSPLLDPKKQKEGERRGKLESLIKATILK
jgi:hypothetical protein